MALAHSPSIVTNGLIFAYDMANTQKSWKGRPTTNLVITKVENYTGFGGAGWWLHPGNTVSVTSQELPNGNIGPVFNATTLTTGGLYGYNSHALGAAFVNGTQYTVSFWARAFSGTASITVRDADSGGALNSSVSGITNVWQRFSFTWTANASTNMVTFTGSNFSLYDVQLETNSFATPFVVGTRSNTQAILDLTNQSTITATSPTYNSNGTFSFNGGTQRLDISNTIGPINNNFSIAAWINSTNIAATQNIVSMNGPYFMRIDGSKVRFNVLAGGSWLFQPGTTILSSNTWYYFTMVYNFNLSLWIGYINGVQEFSVAKSGTIANSSFYSYVGYTPEGGEQSNFLGQIAVVQYYNQALTAQEVQQNFQALRGRYGV
jgi:hypothetical protein